MFPNTQHALGYCHRKVPQNKVFLQRPTAGSKIIFVVIWVKSFCV
ncbi:hypothetical protein ALIPUT_00059 [Alistipes putredinis DSM 17216]|uniref:Uncharacterized protein n=1 Tax=Alistipes putredinis DSM 17216 TaxID=445970 RepID=B0MTH1_9BACT|nr:hypothetical protein ALIPUT_00059 [Alistipes putredinis DSM 17216]